jgi:hypothetical protein
MLGLMLVTDFSIQVNMHRQKVTNPLVEDTKPTKQMKDTI